MSRLTAVLLAAALALAVAACKDSDKGLRCTGPAEAQVCTPYDKEN